MQEKNRIKSEFLENLQAFANTLAEYVSTIRAGNGTFKHLGEAWFDDYWMNFGKITTKDADGNTKKIISSKDFLKYKGVDENLVNAKTSKKGGRNGR